jgi:DNA-binding response OmpR family regulator
MKTSRERILLVESDPDISDLIARQTLQAVGYQVQIARLASQALQEIQRFAPDVIITDIALPDLSGKDLLVALNSQGVEAPVIVIGPKGMESDLFQAFRLGATDFLIWPMREAEVVAAVERVMKQVRTRRERAQRLKQERKDFFKKYSPEARQILDELLEKYADHGDAQFLLPDVLHVPPISNHGNPGEIIRLFGGAEQLRTAVTDLQGILYGS